MSFATYKNDNRSPSHATNGSLAYKDEYISVQEEI